MAARFAPLVLAFCLWAAGSAFSGAPATAADVVQLTGKDLVVGQTTFA